MPEKKRCSWPGSDPLYVAYHDEEWGVPEYDSRALFEKLLLDGFQAGLSWITILKRTPGYYRAFAGFDPVAIAAFGEAGARVVSVLDYSGMAGQAYAAQSARNARAVEDALLQLAGSRP